LLTDREAGVTNLANEISLTGEKFDDVVFAKAEFTQPILNFRSSAQLLDANSDAGFDSAQGTDITAGIFPLV
jgi:hypothetical protein